MGAVESVGSEVGGSVGLDGSVGSVGSVRSVASVRSGGSVNWWSVSGQSSDLDHLGLSGQLTVSHRMFQASMT